MKCKKCRGDCEPVIRGGQYVFHFCRVCKIPFDQHGAAVLNSSELSSFFNPLKAARSVIGQTHGHASSVAKTAFEVLLIQSMWEAYFAGIKDGVLLAYSQDVGSGEPVNEA